MRYWLRITGIVEFDVDDKRDDHIRGHLEDTTNSSPAKYTLALQEFQEATNVVVNLTECEEQ